MHSYWRFFILTFGALTLSACNPPPWAPSQQAREQSELRQERSGYELLIQPARPVAETPFTLKLSSSVPFKPGMAVLRAVSMDMGSVPVTWEPLNDASTQWQATVLVGSCGDPQMQWQLNVPVRLVSGSNQVVDAPLQISFPLTTLN